MSAIYPVLNWSKPARTLAVSSVSNFVFIPVVHTLMWGVNLAVEALLDKVKARQVTCGSGLREKQTEGLIDHRVDVTEKKMLNAV